MKQNVKKNDLIKFNYIFSPKEKYYGLICEVKSCYSFKTLVNVLIDNSQLMQIEAARRGYGPCTLTWAKAAVFSKDGN